MTVEQCKKLVQYARTRDLIKYAAIGLNDVLNHMPPEEQETLIAELRECRKYKEAQRWKRRNERAQSAAPPHRPSWSECEQDDP
jgi:hypothetical protein